MNQNSTTFHLYPELLDDLLNLEYIIVFNSHGLTLFSLDIGKIEIPDLLISGLLQAIITMLKEFNPQKLNKKEKRLHVKEITDGDYGFLVYYCQSIPKDEHGIVLACFCSKSCTDHFKSRLKTVTSSFAEKFHEEIKNFNGNVSPFNEFAQTFFEETMWLNFLSPLKVNINKEISVKSNEQDIFDLIKLIKDLEGSLVYSDGFFLREVIEKALRMLNISYFHLLQHIIDLINDSFFVPALISEGTIPVNDKKEIKAVDQIKHKKKTVVDEKEPILSNLNSLTHDEIKKPDSKKISSETFVSPIKTKWESDFFNDLSKSNLEKLSSRNLVIATLTREIEYSRYLKNHRLLQGQDKDSFLKELSIIDYKLQQTSKNTFSGPMYIFKSDSEGIFVLSGIKYNNEYVIVLSSA